MSVGEFFGAIYSLWNQIIYALSNIRFFDILDIVVIAFIIYKAIEFLKDFRGLITLSFTPPPLPRHPVRLYCPSM